MMWKWRKIRRETHYDDDGELIGGVESFQYDGLGFRLFVTGFGDQYKWTVTCQHLPTQFSVADSATAAKRRAMHVFKESLKFKLNQLQAIDKAFREKKP